jgi:hypothetical protein
MECDKKEHCIKREYSLIWDGSSIYGFFWLNSQNIKNFLYFIIAIDAIENIVSILLIYFFLFIFKFCIFGLGIVIEQKHK